MRVRSRRLLGLSIALMLAAVLIGQERPAPADSAAEVLDHPSTIEARLREPTAAEMAMVAPYILDGTPLVAFDEPETLVFVESSLDLPAGPRLRLDGALSWAVPLDRNIVGYYVQDWEPVGPLG